MKSELQQMKEDAVWIENQIEMLEEDLRYYRANLKSTNQTILEMEIA